MKLYNDFSKRNGSQPPNDWWGQVMAVMIGIAIAVIVGEFLFGDSLNSWMINDPII